MLISASTECWPGKTLAETVEILYDLDFAAVEIALHEDGSQAKPSELITDVEHAASWLRYGHRLDIVAYSVQLASTGDQHYADFAEICRIAKATKVVTLTVPSAELGTPFNEEVEHLQRLVDIAAVEGARVGVKTELGRLSEDPDTLMVLCNNVDGLGITLDPSVYIVGPAKAKSLDRILKFVYHVHLRDTKPDKFQVSVGQGDVDYAKLISQLEREKYDRALSIHMTPMEGLDHRVELRKLRRLLETLL
ncbi:MAG: sugar phosphate isomerase/epimerase family protein [Planctomycetaceae bacterium]